MPFADKQEAWLTGFKDGFIMDAHNRIIENFNEQYEVGFISGAKERREQNREKSMNLFELHEKLTAHLFPAYSNTEERFLALALAGEVGELCNMIKKRWRDNADFSEEIKDEIADIRVYLELLAKCFDIEGDKLDAASIANFLKLLKSTKHE